MRMEDFVGKTLRDSYHLKRLIGVGGFGAVYESQQAFLGVPARRVAVKLSTHTDLDPATVRDVFADAFLLAGAMDETTDAVARGHLVHLYDMGLLPEHQNRAFMAMEYVEGTSLADQFASMGRVGADQLLVWARQICRGLAGLHELVPPVLHRDLKPDNVLLGTDLHVRLVDFGLSTRLLHHGYVPGTVGTVGYMAPETMCGTSEPASDVFSVGVILYQGLTGVRPFEHPIPPARLRQEFSTSWWCNQLQTIRPTPPSAMNNTVPGWLDDAILKCLRFNSSQRYHNARTLLKALDPPPPPPGCEQQLVEGTRLREAGNLDDARRVFEAGLRDRTCPREIRFRILRELGAVLADLGQHCDAAGRLEEAWELVTGREGANPRPATGRDPLVVGGSALLRSRVERAALLGQIAAQYRLCSNVYKADDFNDKRAAELGG